MGALLSTEILNDQNQNDEAQLLIDSHRTRTGCLPSRIPNGSRLRNIPDQATYLQQKPVRRSIETDLRRSSRRRMKFFSSDSKLLYIAELLIIFGHLRTKFSRPRRVLTLQKAKQKERIIGRGTPAKVPSTGCENKTNLDRKALVQVSLIKARQTFLPKPDTRLDKKFECPNAIRVRLLEDFSTIFKGVVIEMTHYYLFLYSMKVFDWNI
ncbi:hypothetical protein CROQUDRAFT_314333 [Cronartium quercuum f. sp. fusiforme G11]|uniref:Uncharacterized protein n=1 Tax=Cronartium quercuum f. sp. fusiforme G11 TaxID=708437 RepID=A0A9P6NXX1_9BASI|nr:hypothetical protein CROQUDRAFT_314333 [Cronartium quercuum f. sp. fusiforme G11]